MQETDHRYVLSAIQGIPDKHHPLPPEHFKHQSGIEAVNCDKVHVCNKQLVE